MSLTVWGHTTEAIVHHQQLLDPPRVQRPARAFSWPVPTHWWQGSHASSTRGPAARVVGKTHVAVGEDADQLAALFHHQGIPLIRLACMMLRLAKRSLGADGDRVDTIPLSPALHGAHRGVAARRSGCGGARRSRPLRHDNRHVGLGNRVSIAEETTGMLSAISRSAGFGIGRAAMMSLSAGQQHVVEGQGQAICMVPLSSVRRRFVAAHVTKLGRRR